MAVITFDTAVVTSMMEDAIEFCARKTGLKDREQVLEAMRRGDCSICEYLRHGLIKGVAKYLGSVDDTIEAIYTYEPEYATGTDYAIPASSGLNLIARVNRKSAALSSVVASVSAALAEEYRELGCPKANALCYELDVKVADDDEVQKRIGYGALINSFYVRPTEVWHR